MADTDIKLSVDLDVKDAEKTAQQLQKEVETIFSSRKGQSSSSLTSVEIQMKKATQQAQELREKLQEIASEKIPTESYKEVSKELEKATELYDKLGQKSEAMSSFEKTWEDSAAKVQQAQEKVDNLKQEMEALNSVPLENMSNIERMQYEAQRFIEQYDYADKLKAAEQELEKVTEAHSKLAGQKKVWDELQADTLKAAENVGELEDKLAKLEETGQATTINVEAYNKTQQELDKVNDKLKQQIIHHREISEKSKEVTEHTKNTRREAEKLKKSTDSMRKGFSNVAKVAKKALITIGAMILGVRGLMAMFNKLRAAILEGFENLRNSDISDFKKQIEDLKATTATLKNSLAGAFEPIVTTVIPYIQQLVNWLTIAIDKMAQFIAAVSGQKTYIRAIKQVGNAAEKAGNQAKRALGPLDNLNVLTNPSSGGADSTNAMFEEVAIPDDMFQKLDAIKDRFEELKQIADKILIEPFKEGFTESIGDWQSKVQEISQDAISIKDSLVDIFTNPELQRAQQNFVEQTSETLGQITGAGTRIGLNLAQNIVGGTAQFLEDNKERIALDTADLININTETMDQLGDFAQAIGEISDAIGSESGQGLTASVENLGYTVTTEFERISSKITRDSVELITQPIIDNVEEIQEAVENLNLVATPIVDGMTEAVQQDAESTNKAYDEYIVPVIKDIQEFISWFIKNVLNFWNTDVAPWLQEIATQVSSTWNEQIQPVLDEAKLTIGSAFQFIWDVILKPIFNTLKPAVAFIVTVLWPMIKQVLTNLWDQVRIVFNFIDLVLGGLLRTVRFVFNVIHDIITLDFEGLIEDTMSFIDDQRQRGQRFIQFFVNFFNEKMESMRKKGEDIKNKFLGIIDAIKGKFDEWKEKMLGVIDTINNLVNAWKNGGIAGLISEVKDASSKTSTKSSTSTASAPGYANGQVIPPSMSKHLAVLGDNKHETEVVSPLSTMKEAMIEALATSGVGGGNQEIVLQLDGREFLRAMVKQNTEYKKQHNGASALA